METACFDKKLQAYRIRQKERTWIKYGITRLVGHDIQCHQDSGTCRYSGYSGAVLCGISGDEAGAGNACRTVDQGDFPDSDCVYGCRMDSNEGNLLSAV